MPSPVGHSIVSSSIYLFFNKNFAVKRDWKFLILFVILALFPDMDMIFVLIKNDVGIHRSVTHCFLFVTLAALAIALFFNYRKVFAFSKIFILLFILLLAHIICDFFTLDEILHYGIMLFYPFSKKYFPAPFYLFMGFDWRRVSILFSFYMLKVLSREFLITVPLLLFAILFVRKNSIRKAEEIEAANPVVNA